MGNYKFKFSHMLPNAWFYKLKHIIPAKPRKLNSMHIKSFNNNKKFHPKTKSTSSFTVCTTTAPPKITAVAPPENSCQTNNFRREVNNVPPSHHLSEAPRKSNKKRGGRKKTRASLVKSSAYNGYVLSKTDSRPENYLSYSPDCSSFDDSGFSDLDSEFERQKVDYRIKCRAKDNNPMFKKEFDSVSEFGLKPIITKKIDNKGGDYGVRAAKKFRSNREGNSCHVRKTNANSGVKLRTTSPTTGKKGVGQVHGRKNVSSAGRKSVSSEMKNIIVVKDSFDVQADFVVSVVEMILENNITALEDLEILLVCYLSLNSRAYQNLIIKVFEQIWFGITDM